MPEVTITITTSDTDRVHTCDSNCDCPRALALTQDAIDADRVDRGAKARPLSERLHAMRYAAPTRDWFERAAGDARALEAEVARPIAARQASAWATRTDDEDAWTPRQRVDHLQAAVSNAVRILAMGGVLPADHELVHDDALHESRVIVGNLVFVAGITGSIDSPANGYRVTTTNENRPDGDPEERATVDLDLVQAWLVFWAAETVHAHL